MFSWFFWIVGFLVVNITLGVMRAPLKMSTIAWVVFTALYVLFGDWGLIKLLLIVSTTLIAILNFRHVRRMLLTRWLFKMYKKVLPSMSDTEREALEAGGTFWDADLFSGNPDWSRLLDQPIPTLTEEEQAFLDGPVNKLCSMLDDWQITHELADLPENVWDYLKSEGFFAMIIPKSYGGLEFSALAHSEVLAKVAGVSATAASIIAVPNSLGPAELLLHYGTEAQKDHYLPRLADGRDIPCFGLTSPRAGSDATSITDNGVVCKGTFNGEETIGIKLNWSKRYITLAPVATVLGLAFKLFDPDHLIGEIDDYGITCALIPTDLPGVTTGRRHFPLNTPFQNGPTEGEDVFVPLDFIIGGQANAGKGWKMLVESLTVGRCISLPSNATGCAKMALATSGAYARVRRQFNLPIAKFEGIQEALAHLAGTTYTMEATRVMTAGLVDLGHQPSVISAIVKCHLTDMGRYAINDAMDIHGGKAICLGPSNYLGRAYQASPISITVEGANILTRSLIIFGQGAIRCHPYVFKQMQAVTMDDAEQGLVEFDTLLFAHIGHALSNAARAFWYGLTFGRFTKSPVRGSSAKFYRHLNRYSASFAYLADVSMLALGGSLKRREMISARLGDCLSHMYMASAVLKRFEDQGRPKEDYPLVAWSCRNALYHCQEQMHSVLRNFPRPILGWVVRLVIFPRGLSYFAPKDKTKRRIAEALSAVTDTRARLVTGVYVEDDGHNPMAELEALLSEANDIEPIQKAVRQAVKDGIITQKPMPERIQDAKKAGAITDTQAKQLSDFDVKLMRIVNVDDFDPQELMAAKHKKTKPKLSEAS